MNKTILLLLSFVVILGFSANALAMTETEKQLLALLSSQVEDVVNTLMQLRKPETCWQEL
jgi:hypothetical protein